MNGITTRSSRLRERLQFVEDNRKIFRDRRMNVHRALNHGVRSLRVHRVQQNVNNFVASDSENCGTQNLFCFRVDADFDETLCLTFFVRAAHLAHRKLRGEGSPSRFPYLCVRQAATSQRRVNIERIGLDPVGNPAMVSVKEIVRNNLVVVVGSMRKGATPVAIAQSPYARHARLQLIIHGDVATMVGSNPGPVQSQVVGVGSTSHGQQNVSAYHLRRTFLAGEADGHTSVVFRKRDAFRIQPDVYALSLEDLAHGLGNVFILSPNQARPHFHYRDFAPEPAIDLGKLQPNITSADNDEMTGENINVHEGGVGEEWGSWIPGMSGIEARAPTLI